MADLSGSGNSFAPGLAAPCNCRVSSVLFGVPDPILLHPNGLPKLNPTKVQMPKLDLTTIAVKIGSDYPAPFHQPIAQRMRQRLGDAARLTQFGVNRVELPPGCWSGQRHWHAAEDEFVYVIAGEVVLVTDAGEEVLRAGDCAAFPANTPNAHHLVNRSAAAAVCLEVGTRSADDRVVYADIDMVYEAGADGYFQKDGTAYPTKEKS